jgi:hypothetical protein
LASREREGVNARHVIWNFFLLKSVTLPITIGEKQTSELLIKEFISFPVHHEEFNMTSLVTSRSYPNNIELPA